MTVTLIADVDADRSAPRITDIGQTAEAPDRPAPTAIRLRRPPASEPPYDAVMPVGAHLLGGGSHGLAVPSAPAAAAPTALADTARMAPTATAHMSPAAATRVGEHRRSPVRRADARHAMAADRSISLARQVPSSAAVATRYVRTCVEVLNGFRPASHLRTLPGSVEFAAVVSQLGRRRNGRGHFPQAVTAPTRHRQTFAPHAANTREFVATPQGTSPITASRRNGAAQRSAPTGMASAAEPVHRSNTGSGGGIAPGQRNAPGAAHPFRLQRMRVDEPRDGVAEVVAVLSYAASSLAMALRLERRDGQWLCVLVQVI